MNDPTLEVIRALAETAAPTVRARDDLAEVVLRRARRRRRVRAVTLALGGGLAVTVAAAAAVLPGRGSYYSTIQPSAVMAPTVEAGERVVFGRELEPARGDVVEAEVTTAGRAHATILRVVGLPGDTVACPADLVGRCRGVVVNGVRLAERYVAETAPFAPVTVPADTLFLLGDARDIAHDSRLRGPVPADAVRGVAVQIVDTHGTIRAVPGAPPHRGPNGEDVVDGPGTIPPAFECDPGGC
jgi:signal peptidase I